MFRRVCLVSLGVLLVAAGLSSGSADRRGGGVVSGEILCADSSAGEVVRLDPKTGDTEVLSDDDDLATPGDLAFDGPNKLYVADYNAFGGGGGVLKINLDNGKATTVSDDDKFEQPDGIAVGPDGKIWVTDIDVHALFRVDPQTGKTKEVATDIQDALGVVVPKNGKPLVSSYDAPEIVRVDPKTGDKHVIADGDDGLKAASGIDLLDGKLYAPTGSKLQSVEIKTGKVKTVINPYVTDTYNSVIDPKGRIYTGASSEVIRGSLKNGNAASVGSGFGFCEGFEYVK